MDYTTLCDEADCLLHVCCFISSRAAAKIVKAKQGEATGGKATRREAKVLKKTNVVFFSE